MPATPPAPARRRALLVVNRAARKGGEGIAQAVARLEALGIDLVEIGTGHPEQLAGVIARQSPTVDCVIVGGGDGTLNRTVPGVLASGLPLGILPLGTANNVARTLGIPADIDAACEVIAAGHLRRIDLGMANDVYFFTTASIGLSVRITDALTREQKRRWGRLAYGLTALRVLARARPFRADIRWEGGELRTRSVQIVIGNGRYYGSAMTVADDARIDDQRLDLYSVEAGRWWEIVRLLPSLKRGSHGEKENVHVIRAANIEIHTAVSHRVNVDGEIRTRTPARFRVLPLALAVYSPATSPE